MTRGEAISKWIYPAIATMWNEKMCNEILEALEQEPKTGHWTEQDGFDGDVYYDCSECGESWTTIEGTPWQNGMAYCPNCGARMIKPQESEDCRNCKKWEDCPCGKEGHESGTSYGYSIGECKDFEPQESEVEE